MNENNEHCRQPVLDSGGHGDDLGAGDSYWSGVISRTTVGTEVSEWSGLWSLAGTGMNALNLQHIYYRLKIYIYYDST